MTANQGRQVPRQTHPVVEILVDRGASGNFIDPCLFDDFISVIRNNVKIAQTFQITTAGGHVLHGTPTGTVQGTIIDDKGNEIGITMDVLVVPGLGRNI